MKKSLSPWQFFIPVIIAIILLLTAACELLNPPPVDGDADVGGNNTPVVSITGVNVSVISGIAVVEGGVDAIFQADASYIDANTLTYQWYVDGTAVPGETGVTFTKNESPPVETSYSITVRVDDGNVEIESDPVVLIVAAMNYTQHLYGFDGASWLAAADPPMLTISLTGMNGTLYALTAMGEIYRYDFTSWVLDDDSTVLSGAISLASMGNALYVLHSTQQIYVRGVGGWTSFSTAPDSGSVAIMGTDLTLYSLALDGVIWRLDADWQVDDVTTPVDTYALEAIGSTLYGLAGSGTLYSRDAVGSWILESIEPPSDSAILGSVNDVLYVITVTAE